MKKLSCLLIMAIIILLHPPMGSTNNPPSQSPPVVIISPDTLFASITSCNDSLILPLTIYNDGDQALFYSVLQVSDFYDDFENGLDKWAWTGSWGLTTNAYEGTYAITESPDGNYGDNWDNYIQTKDSLIIMDKDSASLSFFMQYSLECGYDYLRPQINVNGGGWITLDNYTCDDSWGLRQYVLTSYVNNGDYIQVRFLFTSDGSYNYDGVLIDNVRIKGITSILPWLSTPVSNGIVAPGQNINFDVVFKSIHLNSGTYNSALIFNTNDPSNPQIIIPCTLEVIGHPVMQLLDSLLDFGYVMQNASQKDTLWVFNTGCDTLHLTSLTSSAGQFTLNSSPFDLLPGHHSNIVLSFAPDSVGNFSAFLVLSGNVVNDTVLLTGHGTAAPALTIIPDSLVGSVLCGDSVLVPLTIINTGQNPLIVKMNSIINPNGMKVYYPFDGSAVDMSGNNKNGTVYGAVATTDRFNQAGRALLFNGSDAYVDAPDDVWFNGDFTVTAWVDVIASTNWSRLFDFGNGAPSNNVLAILSPNGSGQFTGEIYSGGSSGGKLYSPSALPLNQWRFLAFVLQGNSIRLYNNSTLVASGTTSQLPQNILRTQCYIARSNWAADSYFNGKLDDFRIYNRALTQSEINDQFQNDQAPWLHYSSVSDTIAPGDTIHINVTLSALNMHASHLQSELTLTSNDPLHPLKIVPVTMNIYGNPGIGLSDTSLTFGEIMKNTTKTDTLTIHNTGCDTLLISSIESDIPEFSIPQQNYQAILPEDSVRVLIIFEPHSDGNFIGILSIYNNDMNKTVALSGIATSTPTMHLIPDSLLVNIVNCNDSIEAPVMIHNEGQEVLDWIANAMDQAGTALKFNNSGQWVTIGNMGSMPEQGTIEFWEWSNVWQNYNNCFSTSGYTPGYQNTGIRFEESVSGSFVVVFGNDLQQVTVFTLTSQLPINSWHHAAISWNKITNQVWTYYDGNLLANGTYNNKWATNFMNVMIGVGYANSRWWNGKMDEVRIWNAIRSQVQIQYYMVHSLSGYEPGLMAYYNMNEGNGNIVMDHSGHGHNGTFSGATWTTSTIPMQTFLSVNPAAGSVVPGDSSAISIKFNGLNYNSGSYYSSVLVNSNDPLHASVRVNCTMSVHGFPAIQIPQDTLHFGNVMTGAVKTDSMWVRNKGCDTLSITNMWNTYGEFTIHPMPLNVLPKDSSKLYISFMPTSLIIYTDEIAVANNDSLVLLHVEGSGVGAPAISSNPAFFNVTLNCNDSLYLPITISNSGLVDLNLNLGSAGTTGNQPIPPSCIPGTNSYCCNIGITRVIIGGIDNSSGPGSDGYKDYSATIRAYVVPGQTYTITVVTGPSYSENVAAWIDYNNNGIFESNEKVFQSLGGSSTHTGTITIQANAVYNTPLRLRIGSDYYGDAVPSPCTNVTYGQFEDYSVIVGAGVNVPGTLDTIIPGDSATYLIEFNSKNMPVGTYQSSIKIANNDPLHPVLIIPCTLHVAGSAILSFSENPLDFGNTMKYTTSNKDVTLTNTGCDTLVVNNLNTTSTYFSISQSSFSIMPNQTQVLHLNFHPDSVGYFESQLVLYSNVGSDSLPLHGYGTGIPHIVPVPDSLNITVACGDSVNIPLTLHNTGEVELSYTLNTISGFNDALILYYPFNGDYKDYSGHQRDLTNHGAVLTTGIAGYPNTAYAFSNHAYMSYDNPSDIQTNLFITKMTVSLWINISDPSTWPEQGFCVFNVSGDWGDNEGIYMGASTTTFVSSINVNNTQKIINSPIILNQYVYFLASYDGSYFRQYINGSLAGELYAPGVITYSTNYRTLGIGKWNAVSGYDHWFVGSTCAIRLYNRALNEQEIQALYHSGQDLVGMSVNPFSGTISPGDSTVVNVSFRSGNLNAGSYNAEIQTTSNDPLHPVLYLPVHIVVTGTPEINISTTCLNYDTIMQFTSKSDSVNIENPSCAALHLSNIYTSTSSFADNHNTLIVPPHSSKWIKITFSGVTQGQILDTLVIDSEVGPGKVCLSGYCSAIPIMNLNNATINKILSCKQTDTIHLNIRNQGLANLVFHATSPGNAAWLTVPAQIFSLQGGEDTTLIIGFSRIGLNTGLYSSQIQVFSNDPLHQSYTIPVYMLVPNILAPINLGRDTGYCAGGSLLLHAGNYSSFLWNDGSTNSTLSVNSPGTYTVEVLDSYGCYSTDSIHIVEFAYPLADAGADTGVCSMTAIYLHGNASNTLPPVPVEVTIGSGASFTNATGPDPFGTYYADHRVQMIYRKAELIAAGLNAGNITSVGIFIGSAGNPGLSNFNVRIGNTNQASLSNFLTGLTLAYYQDQYNPVTGLNLFNFNTPFYWNGTSNLVVEICFDNGNWGSNSSYQYTNVANTVLGAYCDNCNPGCNISGGNPYSQRANLVIHGDGDLTKYHWTGPNAFNSSIRNPVIQNVTSSAAGAYLLSVNNGYGCINTDTIIVEVRPSPVVEAGPSFSILGGENVILQASVTGGIQPYAYQWGPVTGLNNATILNPVASPLLTTTYTLTVQGNNACSQIDNLTVKVTPRYSVSGHVSYDNTLHTALSNVKIYLENQNGIKLDSAITNQSGNYNFPLVLNGNYKIEAITSTEFGGINATDALIIAEHVVMMLNLSGLKLTAADVNLSHTITSADALLVLHKTVGNINIFPAGKWAFNNLSFSVNGTDVFEDIGGICIGDVNASFIPFAKVEPSLSLENEGFVVPDKDGLIQLPVFTNNDLHLGAITLDIQYPSGLLSITSLTSPAIGNISRIDDGHILFAWNNPDGFEFKTGDPLLVINARLRTQNSVNGKLEFSLGSISEIADVQAQVLEHGTLFIPKIVGSITDNSNCYLGQNLPNPWNDHTIIPYYLSGKGNVTLELTTLLGEKIMTLLDAFQDRGYHSVSLDCKDLPSGVYLYQLRYSGKLADYRQTRRMIISR